MLSEDSSRLEEAKYPVRHVKEAKIFPSQYSLTLLREKVVRSLKSLTNTSDLLSSTIAIDAGPCLTWEHMLATGWIEKLTPE